MQGSEGIEQILAGAGILIALAGLAVGILIHALFLLLAARIVDIPGRSFSKALICAVLGGIASFIVSILLIWLPIIGWILGLGAGFIITAVVVQYFFKTTFGKALGTSVLAWVFLVVLFAILAGIGLVLGAGALMMGGAAGA